MIKFCQIFGESCEWPWQSPPDFPAKSRWPLGIRDPVLGEKPTTLGRRLLRSGLFDQCRLPLRRPIRFSPSFIKAHEIDDRLALEFRLGECARLKPLLRREQEGLRKCRVTCQREGGWHQWPRLSGQIPGNFLRWRSASRSFPCCASATADTPGKAARPRERLRRFPPSVGFPTKSLRHSSLLGEDGRQAVLDRRGEKKRS